MPAENGFLWGRFWSSSHCCRRGITDPAGTVPECDDWCWNDIADRVLPSRPACRYDVTVAGLIARLSSTHRCTVYGDVLAGR